VSIVRIVSIVSIVSVVSVVSIVSIVSIVSVVSVVSIVSIVSIVSVVSRVSIVSIVSIVYQGYYTCRLRVHEAQVWRISPLVRCTREYCACDERMCCYVPCSSRSELDEHTHE
jgi:hypothetical protein